MKQIIHVKNLDAKSGENLVKYLGEMSSVSSVISTPQVRGKRGCIVESELSLQSIHSQLKAEGYETYTPQIAQT